MDADLTTKILSPLNPHFVRSPCASLTLTFTEHHEFECFHLINKLVSVLTYKVAVIPIQLTLVHSFINDEERCPNGVITIHNGFIILQITSRFTDH